MESSIENVKFIVYVAHNGHSFEFACPETTSIELVQTWLAPLTRILPQDQLLICDDIRLEPHRSLASYKLPDEKRHVFLFSRGLLMLDTQPPPMEDIQVKEPVLPSPPSTSLSGHPLQQASDPALKALPLYEIQFRYHHHKGHILFEASHEKFEACRRLHRELQVQNLALDTAKENMGHYYKIIDQMYSEFMKQHSKQHKQNTDVLINFEKDLERLRACQLHPALVSKERNTLLDCIEDSNLCKHAETCASSHRQFQGKVLQLTSIYSELQRDVKELLSTVSAVDFRSLDQMITECARIIDEESSIMQSLSKDVETVKKLVDEGASQPCSVSLRPHDAVSALGPIYDVHDKNHLPRIEVCYEKLGKILEYIRAKKHDMTVCIHTTMQRVASLQSTIRDLRNQLSAFKEAMVRQEELFSEVKVVRRVGLAYRACLAEIVRRKSDMKIYMGQAGQLAERMARIRDLEIARREEFLRVQSRYIPRDVLVSMGLIGIPSQCMVDIEPYDANLLDIDMKDLETYAPESILGTHLKGLLDDGASLHGESVSEGSHVYCSMDNKLEMIDDVTIDEIVGTSKLEVENAWLKAELASVIALLCSIDPYFDAAFPSDVGEPNLNCSAAQKTRQALALKDEHAKYLQDMLKTSRLQCSSYEKRIRELEQRLSDQYLELHRLSSGGVIKEAGCGNSIADGSGTVDAPLTAEPMDNRISESSHDNPLSCKNDQMGQFQEGGDETMSEISAAPSAGHAVAVDNAGQTDDSQDANVSTFEERLASLKEALVKKNNDYAALEESLRVALNDTDALKQELQTSTRLLDECQINCAELEKRLHLAREEAQKRQCTADRKAAEYNAVRATSVKLRGLVGRLRHAILSSPMGSTGYLEALKVFAASLASESNEDGIAEFHACIKALAERVGLLVQQRTELLERCSHIEASNAGLAAELENKTDMLKSQCARHKIDKQARKWKICYTHFHVHELAMFIPNACGHYEAINHGCPNYYLSDESLALFHENFRTIQQFIIGQMVHIKRHLAQVGPDEDIVLSASGEAASGSVDALSFLNPYNLPVGTEYFLVTLAMLPECISGA